MPAVLNSLLLFPARIKTLGYREAMDEYEKRKLSIFNLLNVLGFCVGIFLPLTGIFLARIELPFWAWAVTFSPAMVSILVLVLNYFKLHEAGTLSYFIMYPILTALVYQVSFDIGIELFFLLYGVLSVFFLQRFIFVAIAYILSLTCYFYVFVFTRTYATLMVEVNFPFYTLNHILPACFIFYALFLIKRENTQYQQNILQQNRQLENMNAELQHVNGEIQRKNQVIDEKARLLQNQTRQLSELNSMKNKLFSVISHDLKTPLYALRNLFRSVQQYDLPAEEIKQFVPEVIKDLNYTTALMENLLLWVKSQMQVQVTQPQILEVSELVKEATDLLRLQAQAKQIRIDTRMDRPVFIYADKDMISLVLRNLLSNAIKFTPPEGCITIGFIDTSTEVEVYVRDTGVGIAPDVVRKLFENSYFSTKGTANETGTGLGLMLCKDFLTKNGGTIRVTSEVGRGSIFSFTLPRKRMVAAKTA